MLLSRADTAFGEVGKNRKVFCAWKKKADRVSFVDSQSGGKKGEYDGWPIQAWFFYEWE